MKRSAKRGRRPAPKKKPARKVPAHVTEAVIKATEPVRKAVQRVTEAAHQRAREAPPLQEFIRQARAHG